MGPYIDLVFIGGRQIIFRPVKYVAHVRPFKGAVCKNSAPLNANVYAHILVANCC